MELDTRTKEARDRLDAWGRYFRLRPFEPRLGHRDKNMLQVAVEHLGQIPPPPTGFKPEYVDAQAMQVEDFVRIIFDESPRAACILRAYFCGGGRKGVERLELARDLIRAVTGESMALDRRAYYQVVDACVQRVAGMLAAIARGHEISRGFVRTKKRRPQAA